MAKSSKQIEEEVLSFLDTLGTSQSEMQLAQFKGISKFVYESAVTFLQTAKDNIRKESIVDTGRLESDLTFEMEENGTIISVSIGYPKNSPASKYYDYVNKGVKGVKSGSPNSQYKFKSVYPSKKMVANISQWVRRHSLRDKYEGAVNKTKLGKKRASIKKLTSQAKKQKSLAFAISSGIKRRGLRRTLFFDNAVTKVFGQDFTNSLSKIIGAEITLSIKSSFNGDNNK